MNEEKQSINISLIVKIIYKNIFFIILSTILVTGLASIYATTKKSFKTEINLYGNMRILNEIGESPEHSLNSFEFLKFIKDNSKVLQNIKLSEEEFLKEMSTKLIVQSESGGNPLIKVKFSTQNKKEGEDFSKEYVNLAEQYLLNKKNVFLNAQIKLLEEQYNFLIQNVDIRTTKDNLSDTLVSRLAFYRLLKNDTNPIVRFLNSSTKSTLNKKVVLVGAVFLGLFFGILVAFIKEFSKTIDWKEIKK